MQVVQIHDKAHALSQRGFSSPPRAEQILGRSDRASRELDIEELRANFAKQHNQFVLLQETPPRQNQDSKEPLDIRPSTYADSKSSQLNQCCGMPQNDGVKY